MAGSNLSTARSRPDRPFLHEDPIDRTLGSLNIFLFGHADTRTQVWAIIRVRARVPPNLMVLGAGEGVGGSGFAAPFIPWHDGPAFDFSAAVEQG